MPSRNIFPYLPVVGSSISFHESRLLDAPWAIMASSNSSNSARPVSGNFQASQSRNQSQAPFGQSAAFSQSQNESSAGPSGPAAQQGGGSADKSVNTAPI